MAPPSYVSSTENGCSLPQSLVLLDLQPWLSLALYFTVSHLCRQIVSLEGQGSLVHLRVPHVAVLRAEQRSVGR